MSRGVNRDGPTPPVTPSPSTHRADIEAAARARQSGRWIETAAVAALAAIVFIVHPYGYIVSHPYWIDESWVALLSKAPLRYIGSSSSTPIGWLLIVRWAPFGRDRLRIV